MLLLVLGDLGTDVVHVELADLAEEVLDGGLGEGAGLREDEDALAERHDDEDAARAVDIAELYAAHRVSLVRLAILLVDDLASAEDVVQDAFTALTRRRGALDDPSKALGYLRVSVVNTSRSALRRPHPQKSSCHRDR